MGFGQCEREGMTRAEVVRILLCHRGDLVARWLTHVQYFGPTIVQAAIWGLSLKNRDPFLFIMHNTYTWLFYYLLVILRDGVVRSTRPFFVADCDRSYAVPDAWFCVTTSFLMTIVLCALWYRKRTFWRLVSLAIITFGLSLYIAAPIVNGYFFVWQYLVNLGVSVVLTFFVCLFVWLWLADTFVWAMKWRLPHKLGFTNCFLLELEHPELLHLPSNTKPPTTSKMVRGSWVREDAK